MTVPTAWTLATFCDVPARPGVNAISASISWQTTTRSDAGPSPGSAATDKASAVAGFVDAHTSPDVNDFTAVVAWPAPPPRTPPSTPAQSDAAPVPAAPVVQAPAPPEVAPAPPAPAAAEVAPRPLTIQTFPPPTPTQGLGFRAKLLAFDRVPGDLNLADFTAMIDWGDGTTSTLTAANQGITPRRPCCVVGAHTYRSPGRFTLAVRLFEKGTLAASTGTGIMVAPGAVQPPLPAGNFGAESIVVAAGGVGSVIDVGPSVAFAGPRPPQAPPAPPPAPRAPSPAVTQTQMTDLVLQLSISGSAGTLGRSDAAAMLAADTINLAAQDLLLASLGKAAATGRPLDPGTSTGEKPKD
jgi:hypothetical protein